MRVKSKVIVLALMISMLFSLFSACQVQQTKQQRTTTSEVQTKKESPVVLVWPNVDEGYSAQIKTDASKQVHNKILEVLNVDLQPVFYPIDQYPNRVNMLIASGDQVDVIPRVSRQKSIEYFNDGVIIDLTELIQSRAPDYLAACEKYELIAKAREESKYQGKDLVMPWPTLVPRGQTLQIRTDWLSKLNMDIPTTLEDFEAYMEAVKTKDPNNTGKDDTYGLSAGVWGANIVTTMSMFYCPAGWERWLDESGKLQIAELHPNYKLLLADLARWYKAGYLPPEVFTSADDQRNDWVTSNKVGALATWYSAPIAGIVTLRKSVPEANYLPICIKGKPEAANAYRNENATPNSPVITASSKDPEAAIKFLNYLYTKEGQILCVWGIEDISYKLIDGQPDSILGEDGNKLYYAVYNPQLSIPQLQFGLFAGPAPNLKLYRELADVLETLPGYDPPDKLVAYDTKAFKSEAKLADMDTFLQEQRLKVLVGEIPVSEWDNIMSQWKTMGGEQYLEDINLQYKAWLDSK
jgi:putative aldouronate transport system substrate-binding protein